MYKLSCAVNTVNTNIRRTIFGTYIRYSMFLDDEWTIKLAVSTRFFESCIVFTLFRYKLEKTYSIVFLQKLLYIFFDLTQILFVLIQKNNARCEMYSRCIFSVGDLSRC